MASSYCHQHILYLFLIAAAAFTVKVEASRDFHGFQVLRVNTTTAEGLKILGELYEEDTRLDFWTKPSVTRGTDIMVPLEHLGDLKEYLRSQSIPFTVLIGDVQRILIEEQVEVDSGNGSSRTTEGVEEMNWDSYHPCDTISTWMDKLAQEHPEICKTEIIGKSTEGRPMKLIKISEGGTEGKRKKAIWIDGGIHAREWISTATVTYFINELVTKKDQYADFLSNIDFYILPIMNPDGYAYTWTHDRMWRKTRSDHTTLFSFSDRDCRGVDPNRNFGYKYGGAGTSNNKCSDIYRGPSAFSEPETQAVRDYITKSPADFRAYLTLHSYSQVWVYPWGFASELPTDWAELDSLARAGAAAIEKRYGTKYSCGSSTNVLYAAAGGSDDWAKSTKIKYAYTIELRDTGNFGFLLPSSQIKPTAEETWDGIQVVAHHVSNLN